MNYKWIDDWYTELEKGLINYKRPEDWVERFQNISERVRKPVRNQTEGLTKRKDYGDE